MNNSGVRTKYHEVISETLKSIVMDITMPGSTQREVVRVPKALCRNWQKDTVDIFSGYFAKGVTRVDVMSRSATVQEFDAPDDDVLRMPQRCVQAHKQVITDDVMTSYQQYERLR